MRRQWVCRRHVHANGSKLPHQANSAHVIEQLALVGLLIESQRLSETRSLLQLKQTVQLGYAGARNNRETQPEGAPTQRRRASRLERPRAHRSTQGRRRLQGKVNDLGRNDRAEGNPTCARGPDLP